MRAATRRLLASVDVGGGAGLRPCGTAGVGSDLARADCEAGWAVLGADRAEPAQFAFRIKASAFKGGLLTIAARASTPKSTATKKVALRLPAADR